MKDYSRGMCDLYSITTNQAAIIALFRVISRYVGNLAPSSMVEFVGGRRGSGERRHFSGACSCGLSTARFVCRAFGKRGADVRQDFDWNRQPVGMMGYR